MTSCVHCHTRKGKRTCPALGGMICPQCCGQHRQLTIACPPDCQWLRGLAVVRDEPGGFTFDHYTAAVQRLLAFVDTPANAAYRDEALAALALDDVDGEDVAWLEPIVNGFLAYGARGSDGQRAVERLLARVGATLSRGERAALEALQHAWASLFEVEAVQLGVGLTLRDRVSGELVQVREVSATAQLVPGDAMFAWLMTAGDHVQLTGGAMAVPRPAVAALQDALRGELDELQAARPDAPARALVGELADGAIRAIRAFRAAQHRPKLVTTHGEDVVFGKAHYQVRDATRLRAALARQPNVEAETPDAYVWLDRRPNRALGGGPTLLGRFAVTDTALVFETNARERLVRGRAFLERIAGKAIAHQLDTFEDPDQTRARLARAPGPAAPAVPPEVEAEVVRAYLRDYYLKTWIAEPVPALDGRTPRAMARSKQGRERVARLIDDAERMSAAMPGGDDPALWDDLRAVLRIPPRHAVPRGFGYDADDAPNPAAWLAVDEDTRIAAVRRHHDADAPHPPAENEQLHATMHVIVENQLAQGEPPDARQTLDRLLAAGVTRHNAVHAIASVIAHELFAVKSKGRVYDRAATARALAQLRPADWREP